MSKNDQFNLRSVLTPSFLAIVVVTVVNVVSPYVGLSQIWIALALSFLLSLTMTIISFGGAKVKRSKQLKYSISYGVIIFFMAVGGNQVGGKMLLPKDQKLMSYYSRQDECAEPTNVSESAGHVFFHDWFAR